MKRTAVLATLGAAILGLVTAQGAAAEGRTLTQNEIAAHGPIPGDVSLYAKEVECTRERPTPGYLSSMSAAEISDATRSGLFPCASFTGSHDGPNQVFAWRSADDYPGVSYIITRKPGELYIVGGEYPTPDDPLQVGPFIAKADAASGKEVWRTYLDNPHVSGRWIGNANLNILENGRIAFSWSNLIVLVDADSGEILKSNTLPAGEANPADVNFKHLTVAPDGTLILKDQTRPLGCTLQGTMAIIACARQGMKQQNSILVAVDPDSLEVLASLPLPEPAPSPHIVTKHGRKIAVYLGMNTSLRRYYWDPWRKKLSADESWVVRPMQPGQTTATAPSVIGDWITVQLNGLFTDKAASSVVAVHRDDASNQHVAYPFGKELAPGQVSFAPPKGTADPETSMVYSADMGMQKVAGLKLDQATGEMTTAFVVDAISNTFQPVIGPAGQRVLLLTNIQLPPKLPVLKAVFTQNQYTEQLTWRDARTGKLLAASDFYEPLTINSLTTPGFGGRVYFPTAVGKGFYVMQVMPGAPAEAAK
ncbi:MAG: hypothetical protein ACQGVC_24420 [Myxococcota bacterium]